MIRKKFRLILHVYLEQTLYQGTLKSTEKVTVLTKMYVGFSDAPRFHPYGHTEPSVVHFTHISLHQQTR